jgi:hypothetical protein
MRARAVGESIHVIDSMPIHQTVRFGTVQR